MNLLKVRPLKTIFMLGLAGLLSACSQMTVTPQSSGPVTLQPNPKHVALLLPLSGPDAAVGQAVRDGFLTAYYNTTPTANSPTVVRVYDTAKGSALPIVYQQAVADKADIIIGPLESNDVTNFARMRPNLPVIALNYPVNPKQLQPGFYEFGLSPTQEAAQVALKATSDGHHHALIIYPNDDWGNSAAAAFATHFQSQGGNIVGQLAYKPTQNVRQIIGNLLQVQPCASNGCTPTRRQDFDMILILAQSGFAKQIIPVLQQDGAGNVAMYSTSAIYDGVQNPGYYTAMGNVIFCDIPWLLTSSPALTQAQTKIPANWVVPYQNYLRFYALGMDSFALVDQLPALAASPMSANYVGATGTLYANRAQHIIRQVQWAQFQNGQVKQLS